MDNVVYKEYEINDWLDYINLKFADSNYFNIELDPVKESVTIYSKTNKTKIIFHNLEDPTTRPRLSDSGNEDVL